MSGSEFLTRVRKTLVRIIVLVIIFLAGTAESQTPVGYLKVRGTNGLHTLRVVSVADAIAAGRGVIKIKLANGQVGAADLVETSHTAASPVRIRTPYGTKSWRKEVTSLAKGYGGPLMDKSFGIAPSVEGGFIMAGSTYSYGAGNSDFMLTNVAFNGDFNWGNAYGSNSYNVGKAIVRTAQDGYFMAGSAYSPTQTCWYMYVYHLTSSGSIIYSGGLGTENGDEYGQDCIQATDGNFVIVGQTDGFGSGGNDVFIKKIDYSNGDNIWGWAIGTAENEEGYEVVQNQSGGYAVVGSCIRSGDTDLYFLILDSGGNFVNASSCGGDQIDIGEDVVIAPSYDYFCIGYTYSIGAGSADFYLVKYDQDGDWIWSHAYGGTGIDMAYAGIVTSDGNIVIAGRTNSFGAGNYDLMLIKVDQLGDVLWAWVLGGPGIETGYDLMEASDGTIFVCGEVSNYGGAGQEDVLLARFSADGTACLGYQLGIGGSEQVTVPQDYQLKMQQISNLTQSHALESTVKESVDRIKCKHSIRKIEYGSRDTNPFTPTVTTICN